MTKTRGDYTGANTDSVATPQEVIDASSLPGPGETKLDTHTPSQSRAPTVPSSLSTGEVWLRCTVRRTGGTIGDSSTRL